jgi:hypothetical protein
MRGLSGYVRTCLFNIFGLSQAFYVLQATFFETYKSKTSFFILGSSWGYDIQYNDIQYNDTQYNDTQYNETQHNDTQHNETQHNETQHSDTLHNRV